MRFNFIKILHIAIIIGGILLVIFIAFAIYLIYANIETGFINLIY